jgi:hypothetical protein
MYLFHRRTCCQSVRDVLIPAQNFLPECVRCTYSGSGCAGTFGNWMLPVPQHQQFHSMLLFILNLKNGAYLNVVQYVVYDI